MVYDMNSVTVNLDMTLPEVVDFSDDVQNTISLVNAVSGVMSEKLVRSKIEALEAQWLKMPQIEIPVIHRYAKGIYAREITIPKGTALTGRIYKDDHFDIMVSGDITVSSDEGIKRLKGFNIFNGAKGKKRAGIAHEDTRWITFCACEELPDDEYLDKTTVEKFSELDREVEYIEEAEIDRAFKMQTTFKISDYPIFKDGYLAAKGLPMKYEAYKLDFKKVLSDFGFSEEEVRRQSEIEEDQIDIKTDGVVVENSDIEGMGLFATQLFKAGEIIMVARIDGKRTIAGRYVNHSPEPNAKMIINGNDFNLVALRDIEGEEITTDYKITLETRAEVMI